MIYVHIPYCHRKCTYCAFYSVVTAREKQPYVDAVCRELTMRRDEVSSPVRTVYFGGGTPSLLTAGQLGQIVDVLYKEFDMSGVEEVTLEANPEDLTHHFLADLKGLGFFNRLSIGVQSFHDEDLRMLNRRHDSEQAVQAVKRAVASGFGNVSIDLIYGLPGRGYWLSNLKKVSELPVQHLSAYALTLERGTILERQVEQRRVALPSDEESVLQYEALLEWAAANGFEQYEISNFCRPGYKAVHNSHYWDRTPYLGVGAAAHSFDGMCRRWNVADAERYIQSVATGHVEHDNEELGVKDAYNEYLMTALRTVAGIEKEKVAEPFVERLRKGISRFVAVGLIEETPTHFRPTRQGLLHADGIAAELFV